MAAKRQTSKRENGMGSVQAQRSGNYRWRATVGLKPNGQPIRLSGTAATRDEANAAIAAARTQMARTTVNEPTRITVSDYLETWLAHKTPQLAPKSVHNYTQVIELHIKPDLGQIKLQKVRPAHIQALFDAMAAKGLSDTQRQVRNVLNAAFEHARRLQLISDNPAKDIRPAALRRQAAELGTEGEPDTDDRNRGKALTPEEVTKLLPVLRGNRWGLPFEFMLHTGLRRAEICGLRWSDVDLENGIMQVRTNRVVVAGSPQDGPTKTRRSSRSLRLSAEGLDCLRRQKAQQELERQALAPGRMKGHPKTLLRQRLWQDSGRVFTQICGSELHPDTLLPYLRRLCKAASIRPATNHMMRHTYASLMLRASVPLEVVSQMLGHERPSFTADVYRTVYQDEIDGWALNLSDLAQAQIKQRTSTTGA